MTMTHDFLKNFSWANTVAHLNPIFSMSQRLLSSHRLSLLTRRPSFLNQGGRGNHMVHSYSACFCINYFLESSTKYVDYYKRVHAALLMSMSCNKRYYLVKFLLKVMSSMNKFSHFLPFLGSFSSVCQHRFFRLSMALPRPTNKSSTLWFLIPRKILFNPLQMLSPVCSIVNPFIVLFLGLRYRSKYNMTDWLTNCVQNCKQNYSFQYFILYIFRYKAKRQKNLNWSVAGISWI
jgi:hypothetical protein